MATSGNKLIPIVAIAGLALVGFVLVQNFRHSGSPVKADAPMKNVPHANLPGTAGADNDTPEETLRTVIASNNELREQVTDVLTANKQLRSELAEERRRNRRRPLPELADDRASQLADSDPASASASASAEKSASTAPTRGSAKDAVEPSALGRAVERATGVADTFVQGLPDAAESADSALDSKLQQWAQDGGPYSTAHAPGLVSYVVRPPMGYAIVTADMQRSSRNSKGAQAVSLTQFVRTTVPSGSYAADPSGPASKAAQQASRRKKNDDIPYFTVPENATLVGAVAMTSLIGRVPIDDRVNDPMQFKAVVGRDNLAANGFELPPDIAGMIVTGIAIGDMALSCTQGKVHSVTFVFNDGAIRTITARSRGRGAAVNTQGGGFSGNNDYLGFISDMHGNPCIPGEFVTNAARYLTDIVGLATLGVAGQAYADAQRTVYSGRDGSSSSVTGSVGHYALGQAVSGATNEVQKWMLERMKNSFDAVIVPSGRKLVIHLDRELQIDKAREPRRLVERQQELVQGPTGAHYGLD